MNRAEGRATREQNEKLSVKKKDFRSGKNISRIYSNLTQYWKKIKKKGYWPQRNTMEVWKTKIFDMFLELYNAVYKQNTIEKWTKGCILLFHKKGELGVTKNYRSISLIVIAAKAYNVLLLNCVNPKSRKFLGKSEWLSKKSIHNLTHPDSPSNHWKGTSKESPSHLISYSEERWSKYYLNMVFPKKMLAL